jgi:hypothetical protein
MDFITRVKTEMDLRRRRGAAQLLGEYTPPPLAHADDLLAELDAAAEPGAAGEWASFTAQISAALRANGADQFLRLAPIAKTLHSRQRSAGRRYLAYLLASPRFCAAIHRALTESPIGKPLVNPHYPLSSPLLVQHAYHLVRLREETDFELAAARRIVEFGGGYGSFYRLLRNLGYRERYLICDLPVMCALQRFYLRNLFPTGPQAHAPENLQWLSGDVGAALAREMGTELRPSLFIATWSLSETPPAVRDEVAPLLERFDYILCAYQRAFSSYDNRGYFASLEQSLPQFSWHHAECPVYRNNFYLIGRNAAAALQEQRAGSGLAAAAPAAALPLASS